MRSLSLTRTASLALLVVVIHAAIAVTSRVYAAPVRCVDRMGWHVCYEPTATDGLRVSAVTFEGESVMASGSMPQIDVAYTGFTLLDELGTAMVPAKGEVVVRAVDRGFEVSQVYEMAAWPQCGTYRYDQSWRFYDDGRLEPFVTIFGPGVEGPHTYRVYWRMEIAPGGPGGDGFEQWNGQWTAVPQETKVMSHGPSDPQGAKWRVVEAGEGRSMGTAPGDVEPKLWALRKNPSQGDIDLPAQRRPDFPDQWLNGESLQGAGVILWYEMAIFKATNCDQTMRVGSGPMLFPVEPPPPTPTPTLKPPTPSVVIPTPGATPEGGSTVGGSLELQGRSDAGGVIVTLDGTPRAVTDPSGSFAIVGVSPGEHVVAARPKGYLCVERAIAVEGGTPLELPAADIRGGDVVDDGVVNILDLTAVGAEYGNAAPGGSRADVNLDGTVGILDLVLVSSNYGRACPTEW